MWQSRHAVGTSASMEASITRCSSRNKLSTHSQTRRKFYTLTDWLLVAAPCTQVMGDTDTGMRGSHDVPGLPLDSTNTNRPNAAVFTGLTGSLNSTAVLRISRDRMRSSGNVGCCHRRRCIERRPGLRASLCRLRNMELGGCLLECFLVQLVGVVMSLDWSHGGLLPRHCLDPWLHWSLQLCLLHVRLVLHVRSFLLLLLLQRLLHPVSRLSLELRHYSQHRLPRWWQGRLLGLRGWPLHLLRLQVLATLHGLVCLPNRSNADHATHVCACTCGHGCVLYACALYYCT